MVYVLNKNNKPLMPCVNVVGRLLVRDGKAKVVRRTPFTIKLKYDSKSYTQPITLGIDTGSSKIGSSAIDVNGNVLYLSEVEIRNDVTDKMKKRLKYRRMRRNRKTRYRKPRWLNRKNSIKKNRFSPTMVSKFNSHIKEINFVKSILPISKVILETGTFDLHALKNPEVLVNKDLYQRGINFGFANTKAFVLDRDSYTCQSCKGKKKDNRLEVHHIIYRSYSGSDEESNLITLCKNCHDDVHSGVLTLKLKGKSKGRLKHTTQMNSIRLQLLKRVDAKETFGFITKEYRQLLGLSKEHYNDAVAIASEGKYIKFKTDSLLLKKCVSKGDYQQTKGIRSQMKIPTGKLHGFRKFDKVKYSTKEYFIKGRQSTGYCILMDVFGNKVDFSNLAKGMKIPKMSNLKRLTGRNTWITLEKNIQNIF